MTRGFLFLDLSGSMSSHMYAINSVRDYSPDPAVEIQIVPTFEGKPSHKRTPVDRLEQSKAARQAMIDKALRR